ncbi:hypothetical protein Raf01_93640 [Rugosimonospora africana]|uniref:Uncharacterized protein n=1 Tax=Rugosimonospora africana TaxID=556532 RepID=A0A8J3VVZ0_9ACTN|nr:hypothetical protein Raf01_93640 [Rugosimonospora africana]
MTLPTRPPPEVLAASGRYNGLHWKGDRLNSARLFEDYLEHWTLATSPGQQAKLSNEGLRARASCAGCDPRLAHDRRATHAKRRGPFL